MKSIMERIICWRIPPLWLIKRGAVSWQDGGERSSWRLPARKLKHWWLSRGREASRRAGYRGGDAARLSRAAVVFRGRAKTWCASSEVQRCVERAVAYGALAALDDWPRPGKEPTITPEAKAWLVSLACDKAKHPAIRTSRGRPGCWHAMPASMDRGPDTIVSPIWFRARCASFSARRV